MSQNYDANVAVNADFQSGGRQILFHGSVVINLLITNNSGVSVQYSPDAGVTWTTLAAGASASPAVPDPTTFFMRRISAGGSPAFVRMSWRARDSIDTTNVAFSGLLSPVLNPGLLAFASDLGENGSLLRSNGTRWRPINGLATLKTLAAAVSGIANTESIVMQTLLPVGAWQTNDAIRVRLALAKSGATDSGLLTVRIGAAGTTADTAVTGLSSLAVFVAGNRTGGFEFDLKLASTTSVQKVGNAGLSSGAYGAAGNTVAPAATTIADATLNALYVSVGLASGGATDTLTIQSGSIQLVTP